MATKVFHIELRVPGVRTPAQHKAIERALVINARNIYGAAVLVMGDGTRPVIACYSEDMIVGQEKILVDNEAFDPEEGEDQ